MAQLRKGELKLQVKLKSPAEEVYTIYRRTCYLFPTIMPSKIHKVELTKDGWESLGSERRWTYAGDNRGSWVDSVEATIDPTKSVTFSLQHQVPKNLYTSLKTTYQFTPSGEGCKASAVLKFDKQDDSADPNDYIDFIREMLEAVDEYLQGTRRQA